MIRILRSIGGCAALLVAAAALQGCGGSSSDTHAADDKALRDLVDRTVAAAGRRDFGTYAKYYGPNTTLALPGEPISTHSGPMKIELPAGYAIKMVTVRTEFSSGGDLGYALGTFEQTAPDKTGALKVSVGKWMSVFRKQPDGTWGAVADTYNVDPPNP